MPSGAASVRLAPVSSSSMPFTCRPSVVQHDVFEIAVLDGAVRIEDRRQQHFRRAVVERRQVRPDRMAHAFQLVAIGAALGKDRLAARPHRRRSARRQIRLDQLLPVRIDRPGQHLLRPLAHRAIAAGQELLPAAGIELRRGNLPLLDRIQAPPATNPAAPSAHRESGSAAPANAPPSRRAAASARRRCVRASAATAAACSSGGCCGASSFDQQAQRPLRPDRRARGPARQSPQPQLGHASLSVTCRQRRGPASSKLAQTARVPAVVEHVASFDLAPRQLVGDVASAGELPRGIAAVRLAVSQRRSRPCRRPRPRPSRRPSSAAARPAAAGGSPAVGQHAVQTSPPMFSLLTELSAAAVR